MCEEEQEIVLETLQYDTSQDTPFVFSNKKEKKKRKKQREHEVHNSYDSFVHGIQAEDYMFSNPNFYQPGRGIGTVQRGGQQQLGPIHQQELVPQEPTLSVGDLLKALESRRQGLPNLHCTSTASPSPGSPARPAAKQPKPPADGPYEG